jgi:hypothetical protein
VIAVTCLALAAAARAVAPATKPATRPASPADDEFLTDVPPYRGSAILCRPTDTSVTLSVILAAGGDVRVVYGEAGKPMETRTAVVTLPPGEPREIVLDPLRPDSAYAYRVVDAATSAPLLPEREPGRFHTQRRPGAPFTFTVQADSHLDGNTRVDLYERCLANQRADAPDFLIDLGDTFMTGKHPTRASAAGQYAAQRYYLGQVADAAPLFLVLGNHDGEETKKRGSTDADGLAVWSCLQRKRFFPNPEPDAFYTGNATPHPHAGPLQNYYAWTWGDALFVALDAYWTSPGNRGGADPWRISLGRAQYDWLAATLRASKARHKLVFVHQLVGGLDQSGRGGAEAASLFEWGGRERDGRDTFAEHRPGWPKPLHQLFVEAGVTAVFHGHDHFYARQEKDGIVYQLVPQPGARNVFRHFAADYGYAAGEFLPSAGHLRVTVSPADVTVEYVRSATPDLERRGIRDGAVAARYVIARGNPR